MAKQRRSYDAASTWFSIKRQHDFQSLDRRLPLTVPRPFLTFALLFWLLLAQSNTAQTGNQGARKFDEFGDALVTDIKARADNFAIELQNNPETKGFVIVYRSRRDLPGISYRYAHRIRDYLVMTRGIPDTSVVVIDGGEADCLSQELWIVPPGTTLTPRSDAYQRNFVDKDSAQKFDEVTWGGDDLSPGIWAGELEAYATALRNQPRARAYLIAYGGYYVQHVSYKEDGRWKRSSQIDRDPPGTARKALRQAWGLLVREYHFLPSRIHLTDGGYRKWGGIELWIVPRSEHWPIPTPNSFPLKRAQRRK
jgi:hypothetical protein